MSKLPLLTALSTALPWGLSLPPREVRANGCPSEGLQCPSWP